MSTPPFVHLHCHSHYSLLDGASPIDKLVARAKELGMTGLALTDHGNLHGALEFYQTAKKAGINPIVGYEAYIAPDSRFKKEVGGLKEASYHLTLLAKNRVGFKNLLKLASAAYLEGFYFKPRIDRELLAQYNEGIICLSGCVSSEFSRMLLKGESPDNAHLEEARQVAAWFHQVFGDRYFIEIQNNGLEIQRLQMQGAVEVARQMGLPLVCTNDSHYVNREDAEAQDVLLCINTGKFRTDTNRMRMEGDQFYLRSPAEMHAAFAGYEEALRQTQTIADSVSIELDLGKRHFPTYTPPENKAPSEFLRELCIRGLRERYADKPERWVEGSGPVGWAPPTTKSPTAEPVGTAHPTEGQLAPEVLDRLDRELAVINQLGFPNYFLIVWDFVRYAREHDIPATARGSGVGALVAYALYLSHVCPLEYDLLFERFLDTSRLEAPDIDIDFCKDRRGEVINYVKAKYGTDNVAQIGTFGTLAARAAIRDVGRAMGIPIPQVDKIVAMVPDELGIELAEALEKSSDLKRVYDSDAQTRELLNLAMKIEGLARNVGTHAAAVVIADQPLVEYVPLCRVKDKEEVITQWSMGDVERAGLLKMDLLGLRNLTILSKAIELIEQTTGRRVDPYKFPLDDAATYALLCRGETKGIFQLESGGIRDLLTKMKPDHFRDIIATNALYRPGPLEGGMVDDYVQVKHGRKRAEYIHPVMKDVLEETHGVMVYQEQVMRILNMLGGIDLPNAYTCIKAISKKKLETIAKFEQEFIAGAVERGLKRGEAIELFEMIKKFAGYGFNKSHSTAYALIAYMTAYLKTHFAYEFMAALLCGDIDARNFKKKDSLVDHLEDCRRMGIEVLPPDVNSSDVAFGVRVAESEGSPKSGVEAVTPVGWASPTTESPTAGLVGTAHPTPSIADSRQPSSQPGTWDLVPGTSSRAITFGLSAIKGCGEQAAAALVDERTKRGEFRDIFDFCERVDPALCNRATIESLVKAGAFDFTGARRAQLLAVLDRAMQRGASLLADRKSGQKGLFDAGDDDAATTTVAAHLPDMPEWNEKEKLANEKEVLGFYLTSHPLAEHAGTLATYCTHTTASIAGLSTRTEVLMGGLIGAIKHSQTKNPRAGETNTRYAMFDLEDMEGMIRCILWPSDFVNFGQMVVDGAIVALRGAVDRRPGSEEANLIVNEILPLSDLATRFTRTIRIRVEEPTSPSSVGNALSGVPEPPNGAAPTSAASVGNALSGVPEPPSGAAPKASLPPGEGRVRGGVSDDKSSQIDTRILTQLHEIIRGYPGTCEVELALVLADGAKFLLKSNSLRVDLNAELRSRIDDLLGPGNVKLIAASPSARESASRGNGNGNGGNGRGNYARRETAVAR
jgi:DNA polymerase-3 subunit alpha